MPYRPLPAAKRPPLLHLHLKGGLLEQPLGLGLLGHGLGGLGLLGLGLRGLGLAVEVFGVPLESHWPLHASGLAIEAVRV